MEPIPIVDSSTSSSSSSVDVDFFVLGWTVGVLVGEREGGGGAEPSVMAS